jgi:methylmalonyl-CoA mutase cobalamin-binding domain/chain
MTGNLSTKLDDIARQVVDRCFHERPELDLQYGPVGRSKCLQDTIYHLQFLRQALAAESLPLFLDYVQWAKILLAGVKVPLADLVANLKIIDDVLGQNLVSPEKDDSQRFVRAAIQALPGMPLKFGSFIDPNGPNAMLARTYLNLVLAGQPREAAQLILRAADTGTPVRDIYLDVFQPTQREVGRLWQTNQISVAQEHQCSAITERNMALLSPKMVPVRKKNGLRLLAACIGGELHDVGIRMVADFLEAEGWEAFFLGANTPPSSVIRTLKERQIDLVALSATMAYHVDLVRSLISSIRADAIVGSVKIIVGGHPFNIDPDLWKRVGADAYGRDAEKSADEASRLVQVR